jgi:TolB-like protein
MTASRRLAAIVVADVVGYSRLMEADEAGTLAALKERRKMILEPVVKEHGGRVVKLMGDGVLIEFASAVNAVKAAITLQQRFEAANEPLPEARRIVLRIGINLGDVIGEGSDIYGDGVNIASRLEAIAEPGGICLSEKVFDEVSRKIDAATEPLGEVTLKNVERPVRAHRILLHPGSTVESEPAARARDKPAIAVLPFVNMGGGSGDEAFADGLTEDIIAALSRSATLLVIARTSVFAYKGKAYDIKRIARELDVSFVLEGSVRRSAERLRVVAQLIDAATGTHIWAEKYDGGTADIFDIQDDITRSVAAATHTTIFSSFNRTRRALELIGSPAYRKAARGNSHLFEMTPAAFAQAAALAEEALALEPDLAYAHRVRANAFIADLSIGVHAHSPENVERGVSLAAEALRRAPDDEWCHWLMAYALAEAGRYEEALVECDIGLDINPNASMIAGDKGDILIMLGRPEEAIPLCRLALHLNSRDPICFWWENSIATAHFILGRNEQARELARKVFMRKPDHIRAGIVWAAAAGMLGIDDEAREAMGRCLAKFPQMNAANVMPNYIPRFRRAEDCSKLLDGLRKAGLPE